MTLSQAHSDIREPRCYPDQPISMASKTWTCPPWFRWGWSAHAAAAASSEPASMMV